MAYLGKTNAEYMREWRAKNLEKVRSDAVKWRNAKIARLSAEELAAFRAKEVFYAKRRHLRNKEKIFAAYGGRICKCCGETEECFLSIDHIENNGNRLVTSGVHPQGTQFYEWVVKNGFPAGLQILCMNCQFGKKNNKGVCPHQLRR